MYPSDDKLMASAGIYDAGAQHPALSEAREWAEQLKAFMQMMADTDKPVQEVHDRSVELADLAMATINKRMERAMTVAKLDADEAHRKAKRELDELTRTRMLPRGQPHGMAHGPSDLKATLDHMVSQLEGQSATMLTVDDALCPDGPFDPSDYE